MAFDVLTRQEHIATTIVAPWEVSNSEQQGRILIEVLACETDVMHFFLCAEALQPLSL